MLIRHRTRRRLRRALRLALWPFTLLAALVAAPFNPLFKRT